MTAKATPSSKALLVRGLSPDVVERLRARAKRNHRSLEAEVRAVLTIAAEREDDARAEAIRMADDMRARLGRMPGDSTDLIREDRER